VRKRLLNLKERVLQYVHPDNEPAMAKARHYIAALDAQLAVCDKTDAVIDRLDQPIGQRYWPPVPPESNKT